MRTRPISLAALFCLVIAPAFAESPPASLRDEVAAAPRSAPKFVAAYLRSAGRGAAVQAGAATTAAIQGLGEDATARQIAGVVYAATRTVPDSVLDIVHAAALASPGADAPEIVRAAVSAVPNPWKQVTYRRIASRPEKGERDDKDFKEVVDNKSEPREMTLAEAIVQTVLDARPGLNPDDLELAGDVALLGDPNDPRFLGAVGDVGNSNYGNEPIVGSPTPPPIPPVSP
jgi:hypothetical protein